MNNSHQHENLEKTQIKANLAYFSPFKKLFYLDMNGRQKFFSNLWLIREGMPSCTYWSVFDPNWVYLGHFRANLAMEMLNITIVTSSRGQNHWSCAF